MPIYEYICQKCRDEIEVIQKFSDPLLKKHKRCGGKLEKKLSRTAFHLKGSGWYADGYSGKKDSKASPAKTESDKPEKKTDKKVDTNTSTKSADTCATPAS